MSVYGRGNTPRPLRGPQGQPGARGNSVFHGFGAPGTVVGAPNDFYIDLLTKKLYGPKDGEGLWGEGFSLIGPKGDQGVQGLQGPQGLPGSDGKVSAETVNLALGVSPDDSKFVLGLEKISKRNGRTLVADGFEADGGPILFNVPASSPSTQPGAHYFTQTTIYNESVDVIGAGGFKVEGRNIVHTFGGANATGGRHAWAAYLLHNGGPTSATNPDRNYTAANALVEAWSGDGGTGLTMGTAKGAYFGFGALARLRAGATNVLNVTSAEFNVEIEVGASVAYRSGIQIAGRSAGVQGSVYDAVVSLSDAGSADLDGLYKHGVLFSDANSQHPVHEDGTLIGTDGAWTVRHGIDFSSYSFTGSLFKAQNAEITGAGSMTLAGVGVPVIRTGVAGYDPPSLPAGASNVSVGAPLGVSVPGCVVTDFVSVSCNPEPQGVTVTGYVRVPGEVRVVFTNTTGATVDLPATHVTAAAIRTS